MRVDPTLPALGISLSRRVQEKRAARVACAGDAEENYYSPRSQASFSDSFTSAADTAERSASEGAEQPLPSPFAAPAAAATPPVRACPWISPIAI